jgi:hypothetical protein
MSHVLEFGVDNRGRRKRIADPTFREHGPYGRMYRREICTDRCVVKQDQRLLRAVQASD